jgi:hypothetical protein
MTKLEQTNRREQNADATLSYVKSLLPRHRGHLKHFCGKRRKKCCTVGRT